MKKAIIITAVLFVASVVAAWYVYAWQHRSVISLQSEHDSLARHVSELQKQHQAEIAAANIQTDSWKQYCDPLIPFCFKYPQQWTLQGGVGEFDRVYALLTNPEKTVSLSYTSPLIKDGGLMGMHVVKVVDLTVDGTELRIIGGYPVSSGTYGPSYTVLNADSEYAKNLAPGKVALGVINPRFDIGKYDAIHVSGTPVGKTFTSSAQAEAWFDSLDGKTMLKILESFAAK